MCMPTTGSHLRRLSLIAVKEEPTAAGFVLETSAQVCCTGYPTQVSEAGSLQDKRTTLGTPPFDTGGLQLEPCISNFPPNIVKRVWGDRKEAEKPHAHRLEGDHSHNIIMMTGKWPRKSQL